MLLFSIKESSVVFLQEYLVKSANARAVNNVSREDSFQFHVTSDPRVIQE